MRLLPCIPFFAAVILSGCARTKATVPQSAVNTKAGAPAVSTNSPGGVQKFIVTPENSLVGKVAMSNPNARFVVLNFPIGHMPVVDQRLNVYRRGLKVGEVKVTGPQRDDNTVADIIAGESQAGDEVRDK